jgi:hypothetical protein
VLRLIAEDRNSTIAVLTGHNARELKSRLAREPVGGMREMTAGSGLEWQVAMLVVWQ